MDPLAGPRQRLCGFGSKGRKAQRAHTAVLFDPDLQDRGLVCGQRRLQDRTGLFHLALAEQAQQSDSRQGARSKERRGRVPPCRVGGARIGGRGRGTLFTERVARSSETCHGAQNGSKGSRIGATDAIRAGRNKPSGGERPHFCERLQKQINPAGRTSADAQTRWGAGALGRAGRALSDLWRPLEPFAPLGGRRNRRSGGRRFCSSGRGESGGGGGAAARAMAAPSGVVRVRRNSASAVACEARA